MGEPTDTQGTPPVGVSEKFESALTKHFKGRRFDEFLRSIARTPHYLPEEDTNGRVLICHGYSGHSGQQPIQHLVETLKQNERFSVVTFDFPNHGLSNPPGKESDLGKIPSFRRWVYAVYVETYKMFLLRSDKNLGHFLVGYSAGAVAILQFLLRYPEVQKYLAGIVLVAVPLEVDHNASAWVLKHKKILEPVFNLLAWFFPNVSVGDLPEGDKKDTLEYHGKVRARPAKEIRNAVLEVRAALGDIKVPVLFIHGDHDSVAPSEQVEMAFRSIGTPEDKKQIIIYKGAPHKILHHAVDDMRLWMRMRNAAKDWVPLQRNVGVTLNETVKMSSAWFFAIQVTLQSLATILLHWRRRSIEVLRKLVRRN